MASSSERDVQRSVIALNARAWGIAFGLVLGGGLLLATLFLVVRSGPNPGQHLRLLSVFFPGYSVSVVGALVGFVYAFVLGYALGRVVGFVYNRIAFR
ncbi:MAG: hypothetical protein IPF87_20900 [Gemmatimonadetes bacterium]|jgi:hypothetical protein|nr:hypothetical protein [Gemmatimonadota bacterium]MBK6458505.1 hypothetical protein [Gemmatimonadota bacterium]